MCASIKGHEEVVEVLLKGRATVDVQDKVLLDWTFYQLFFLEWVYPLKCIQCM